MARAPIVVDGTNAIGMLDAAFNDMVGDGGVVMVRGQVGGGRTTLLGEVERAWSERGVEVLVVPLAGTPDWDRFGAMAIVSSVRDRFEQLGDARLADTLTAVGKFCTPATYRSAAGRSALAVQLTKMFSYLRRGRTVAVLLDDVHVVKSALPGVAAARRAGCVVVATYAEDNAAADLTPLIDVAECLVVKAPLTVPEVAAAVCGWAGTSVDPSMLSALCHGLGSLSGNPATVIDTLRELSTQDRITRRHGVLVLRERSAPFALPVGHDLVRRVNELGERGRALVALVGTANPVGVDDLAGLAIDQWGDLADHERMLDQLVHIGALAEDPAGRLHCPCPALAARMADDLGEAAVRRLHAAFVRYLLRGEHADPLVLADHVTQAGAALPRIPAIVDLLVDGVRLTPDKPEQLARRYHAALLHADEDHPAIAAIVSGLLRALIQVGRFDWLGEVVEDVVTSELATTAIANRAELACAAALAALHTWRPVPHRVRTFLSGTPDWDRPLALCDNWLSANPGISTEEASEVFAPLGAVLSASTASTSGHPQDELLLASSRFDLVAMFEELFESAYRAPLDGPLIAYHDVLGGYLSGRWDMALSSATDVELAATTETPALQLTRVLAAEICANRADFRRAGSWLARVPLDGHLVAARRWVEVGMIARGGDPDQAFQVGLRAYLDATARGEDFAMGLLRLRLTCGAVHGGHATWQQRLLADAEAVVRRSGDGAPDTALLMIRALVNRDEHAATAAVRLARSEGYLVRYAQACVIAARTAADPALMLREAHSVAVRLGAESLRTMVRSVIRMSGMSLPRAQTYSDGLSYNETRIVEMILDGLTNRQIAVRLRVSEKRVESHLTRLFVKTGCRTRLDLAAASAAGRLIEHSRDCRPGVRRRTCR